MQMLNICMERRRIREGGLPFAMETGKEGEGSGAERDSDEEFFDCSDDDAEDEAKKARHAPWNQPVGRLSRLGKMLLVDSDEPLYIPITQEPVPKTEDQLEDDAEVMLKLGPGNELCAQMMSASLLSDMESFKAANPAGKLEDFIRWYSPRDWLEEDTDERDPFGRKGHLSSRMLIPGNTWQTVWESARPVPARRQRRLFDDTKEAEKVLHYLESRTVGQIVQLTIAALFHTAILKVHDEGKSHHDTVPNFAENVEKITSLCCKLSRESWTQNAPTAWGNSHKKYELLLADITFLENVIVQARSLTKKLFGDKTELSESDRTLLLKLLDGYERELPNGAKNVVSQRMLNIFTEAKQVQNEQLVEGEQNVDVSLPDPIEKQFVLRLSGRTVNKGVGSPQFMRWVFDNNWHRESYFCYFFRAILSPYEFRLCGAFSQNTTFY
jgi:Rab3 GTPase-activating protein catalytic subunit